VRSSIATNRLKLRWRRIVRRRKKFALDAADQAEQGLERNFFRRLTHLYNVRRFIAGWVGLLVLLVGSVGLQARSLSGYYQKIAAVEGGTLREGIVGTFSNANPLYAANPADSSVAKLVFSGLLTRDANNNLIPDLADKWESDENGQIYTVYLHKGIKWSDGVPFTAKDVVYTYTTIQNPDAKSPLFSSWQGVKVTQVSDFTVKFELPGALASFPYSLTNGIVPKHLLGGTPVSQLRSAPFNIKPIGTGPFKWESVEVTGATREKRSEQVALTRNETYHFGAPRIEHYVLKTYRDEAELVKAFMRKELTAIVGVTDLPDAISNDPTAVQYNIPLAGSVNIFMNNNSPLSTILNDTKVRQALASATDQDALVKELGYSVLQTQGPLLKEQLSFDQSLRERSFDPAAASSLLDEAGWVRDDPSAIRAKDGKALKLVLVSQSIADYASISQALQKQWRKVGVDLEVKLRPEEDMQGEVLINHSYDVLLYGISMNRDPDVFVYWDSSQANISSSRLNLSEYKSATADKALEAARTRTDPAVRAARYKTFLAAWRNDAPAITLYQPRFLYITRTELVGFDAKHMQSAIDRFNDVEKWTVLQDRVLK
jgi:peptide/nickel transport system substrate-binding protein